MSTQPVRELAAKIDQTLLKPEIGPAALASWVERSRDLGFATLCVAPAMVPLTAQLVAGTHTEVCSVVGFPFGYSLGRTKAAEATHLIEAGAAEVDMVVQLGALLEGDDDEVRDDIRRVVLASAEASGGRALVKVILETGHLNDAEIVRACELAVAAGADYVKTSTGFGPRGATTDDVALMRAAVGPEVGVKAAGGIKDLQAALDMIAAGASRIGTSAGIEILEQAAAYGR